MLCNAGVFASTHTADLQLPLPAAPQSPGEGSPLTPTATPAAQGSDPIAHVPLYVTAGSLSPQRGSAAGVEPRRPVKLAVTVSYWSEACQPAAGQHSIKALTDPANQALGRRVTRWLEVTVLPNLRVASILAQHSAAAPLHRRASGGAPQGEEGHSGLAHNSRANTEAQQRASLLLKLQLARAHPQVDMHVCACARTDVAHALEAPQSDGIGARIQALAATQECLHMPPDEPRCSLAVPVEPFAAVRTFGKPAKPPHCGLHMPPVHEQLQLASNHFAGSVVVLWSAHGAPPARTAARSLSRQPSVGLAPLSMSREGSVLALPGSAESNVLREGHSGAGAPERSLPAAHVDDEMPWADASGFMWGTLILTKQARCLDGVHVCGMRSAVDALAACKGPLLHAALHAAAIWHIVGCIHQCSISFCPLFCPSPGICV